MRLSTILKIGWLVFLLALLFHPVLTIAFIVSNCGIIASLLIIYFAIRLTLGVSIIEYIAKELGKETKEKDED